MGAVKQHFHDEICAAADDDIGPEPWCFTCMDRKAVLEGRAPDDLWERPCPDCNPPSPPET